MINRPRENTPPALRWQILSRDQWTCQDCGKHSKRAMFSGLDVHHIKPYSIGGEHTPENLITLCSSCHKKADLKLQIRFFEEQAVIQTLDEIADARGVERTKVIRWALIDYIERHRASQVTIDPSEVQEPVAA